MTQPMKYVPDDDNEVHDVVAFQDAGRARVTPVAQFEPEVAGAVVAALAGVVRRAHRSPAATEPNGDGIVRAQTFEEGAVYLVAPPFDGFVADRYLMDFYDVNDRGLCSRLHMHIGSRLLRLMTGPDTQLRISTLTPVELIEVEGVSSIAFERFEDELPDTPEGFSRVRHNLVVPANCWVDMQIPRATAHQFNAIGPNAVIDSIHPEESMETLRESVSGLKMTAQTIFFADEMPEAASCNSVPIG